MAALPMHAAPAAERKRDGGARHGNTDEDSQDSADGTETEREIRAKVRELEANRTSWQAGYPEMMEEARKRDIEVEKCDPMSPHVGPEQDKAKARYYFELHRVSALITALEWALGQVEL